MTPGDLKQRITIEQETETPDGSGGFSVSWSTYKSCFARIETIQGNERKFAQRLEENITHVITCRAKSVTGVNTSMRISFQSRLFQIKSVYRKNELSEWTTIEAMEGTGT